MSSFSLICTPEGRIIKFLRDDLGITKNVDVNETVFNLVDSQSSTKTENFIRSIETNGSATDWEINVLIQGVITTLNFSGTKAGNNLLVVGARQRGQSYLIFNEYDQVNQGEVQGPYTTKDKTADDQQITSNWDYISLDQFSQLNNELAEAHRELVRKNAELEKLYHYMKTIAIKDYLTGLYNRRGFLELAEKEIERVKRFHKPTSIIMFDVDKFKEVNDTYGHEIGDHVLEQIALRGLKKLRKMDVFGRLGGDEFSILLPETKPIGAQVIAERLQNTMSKPIMANTTSINISISTGIAAFSKETNNIKEMLLLADKALYHAKESGRNRICTYPF